MSKSKGQERPNRIQILETRLNILTGILNELLFHEHEFHLLWKDEWTAMQPYLEDFYSAAEETDRQTS